MGCMMVGAEGSNQLWRLHILVQSFNCIFRLEVLRGQLHLFFGSFLTPPPKTRRRIETDDLPNVQPQRSGPRNSERSLWSPSVKPLSQKKRGQSIERELERERENTIWSLQREGDRNFHNETGSVLRRVQRQGKHILSKGSLLRLFNLPSVKNKFLEVIGQWAMVVAQLAERSLPTPVANLINILRS